MDSNLAPTYKQLFGSYWVLWYETSNIYSVVDEDFHNRLYDYLECSSFELFKSNLASIDSGLNPDVVAKNLHSYLEQCQLGHCESNELHVSFCSSKRRITETYVFRNKVFQVNFDSDLVKTTIHPSIAHLAVTEDVSPSTVYDIYLDNDQLCLFKDKKLLRIVPKRDYHLIQGKFAIELISIINDKEESDWLGTFHGSTISDGKNALLFIGESGRGKSTLCGLLSAKGFELVADDVSPMLASNYRIYHNPSALSIKEGAFDVLSPLINNFDNFPNTFFNKTKGVIKYLPCEDPINTNYPCRAIVMVNYNPDSDTIFQKTSVKEILETLIPESWLSPNPGHAKHFLQWLSQTHFYKLTYSNTESVIKEITEYFKTFNHHNHI